MHGDGGREAGNTLLIPCPSGQCSIIATEKSTRSNVLVFFLLFYVHFFSRGQTYLSKTMYVEGTVLGVGQKH